MVAQVGYSVAGRSRGRVAMCAVCTVHVEMRSTGFLVEPQNQGRRFESGLGSKPLGQFSLFWPQNRWLRFLGLGLKIGSSGLVIWASKSPRWFLGLGLKTKHALVCQLRHKTDGGRMARYMRRDLAACSTLKQVVLGFPSLASRLVGAQQQVVHVAPSQRLHRDQVEDGRFDATGCVRPYYPYFAVFCELGPKGIVVF
jgi:hypothetical protein